MFRYISTLINEALVKVTNHGNSQMSPKFLANVFLFACSLIHDIICKKTIPKRCDIQIR